VDKISENLEELFLKYRESGDKSYLQRLVNLVNPGLYKLIFRITGQRQLTNDILQETWVIILLHKENFNPSKGSFNKYAYKIAKREIYHWYRKNQKYENSDIDVSESVFDPDKRNDMEEIGKILNYTILNLKKKDYQDAILLYYFAGLKISEVAEILKTTENNIKNWLLRGRKQIENELKKHPEFSTLFDIFT
jgi:RNA polymerase sigma factor (sigma-70 family)